MNSQQKHTERVLHKWYILTIAIILMLAVASCGNNDTVTPPPSREPASPPSGAPSELPADSQQPEDQQLENWLIGRWEKLSGDWLFFFWDAEAIDFYDDGTVVERDLETTGTWSVSGDTLSVLDMYGDLNEFSLVLDGDQLTLTDDDGDDAVYVRATRDRRPDTPLIGRWELVSGSFLYFFYDASIVDFYYDGTVIERFDDTVGEWTIAGDDQLSITYFNGTRPFTFEVRGNELLITDEHGETDRYRRAN